MDWDYDSATQKLLITLSTDDVWRLQDGCTVWGPAAMTIDEDEGVCLELCRQPMMTAPHGIGLVTFVDVLPHLSTPLPARPDEHDWGIVAMRVRVGSHQPLCTIPVPWPPTAHARG